MFALFAVIVFPGCGDNKAALRLSAENSRIKAELVRLQEEGEASEKAATLDLRKEVEKLEAENKALREAATSQEDDQILRDEIKKLQEEFNNYKDAYRVSAREKGKGRSLGDLDYKGDVLKNAVIRSIDDLGVSVSHSNGIARLDFAFLSSELQNTYAYDPNLQEQAKIQLSVDQSNYADKVAAAKDLQRQQNAADNQRNAEQKRERDRSRLKQEVIKAQIRLSGLKSKLSGMSTSSASYSSTKRQVAELRAWILSKGGAISYD